MTKTLKRRRPTGFACVFALFSTQGFVRSRIPQHPLKAAKKKVPYQHVFDGTKRERVRQFWIPSAPTGPSLKHERAQGNVALRHQEAPIWNEVEVILGHGEKVFDRQWNLQGDAGRASRFLESQIQSKPKSAGQSRKRERRRTSTLTQMNLISDYNEAGEVVVDHANYSTLDVSIEVDVPGEGDTSIPGSSGGNGSLSLLNVTAEVEISNSTNVTNETASVVYTTSTSPSTENSTTFLPVRIRAILSEKGGGGEHLTANETEILFEDILTPSILAWSAALRVDRVVGNLTIDPDQLYDGKSCGPGIDSGYPSVLVPPSHLQGNLNETDFVLYLTLGFVTEKVGQVDDLFGDLGDAPTSPPSHSPYSNTSSFNDTAAINETVSNSTKPTCTGEYLAASTFCATDQYDRPIAAMMHLCIDDEFFETESLNRNIIAVMHELGHVLGFNPVSMAHFRRPDGSPVTPRVNGEVEIQSVNCTGPGEHQRVEKIQLPSEEILKFSRVRGLRVAQIVTPTVRQVVRNHFDCQDLNGAELESEDKWACIGDHWERRLFRTDLMNPIVDDVATSLFISPLTLGFFADSGWYQIDLSRVAFAASWGRRAGCSFVNETCLGENGTVHGASGEFFCSGNSITASGGIPGCSPDMTRKSVCSPLEEYDAPLPWEFQYYTHTLGSHVGGSEPFLDYCPVHTGYSNGRCMDVEFPAGLRVAPFEVVGTRNSRCVSGERHGEILSLCLPIACVMLDQTLLIKVHKHWRICSYGGQVISQGTVSIVCPDPVRACPTFYCNRDCLGTGGVCDFESGDCMCSRTSSTTNATVVGPCGDVGNPDLQAVFFGDVTSKHEFLPNSPLADYYVTTPNELTVPENGVTFNAKFIIALSITIGTSAFGLLFFMVRRGRIQQAKNLWQDRGLDGTEVGGAVPEHISFSRNKDKVVASVLLDLRIRHPELRPTEGSSQIETVNETEGSLAEGSYRISIPSDSETSSDKGNNSIESDLKSIELAEPVPPSVVRRRFVTDSV